MPDFNSLPYFNKLPASSARTAIIGGSFGIFAGMVDLLGWAFDIPRLTDWTNEGISMFPNAALCGMFVGMAIIFTAIADVPWKITTARVFAVLSVLLAGLVLSQHISGINLGIDTLVFERDWGQAAAAAPMRMGVPASTSYLLLGVATVLVSMKDRGRRMATWLAVATSMIAMLSITGYWFGANQLFGIAKFTGIALLTSSVIAALSIAMIALVPEHGFGATLRRKDAGGQLFRRLLVPIIVVPLILGWLRILGQNADFYDLSFGTALRTLIEISLFVAIIWWTANSISWHEKTAQSAESRLAAIIESSEDAIIGTSLDGTISTWNAGAEKMFGYSAAEAIEHPVTMLLPLNRIDEETDILARIKRGEPVAHFETIRVRKDGERISVSLTVSPIKDSGGEIVGASKIARDITSRKRDEERLRAVVEATPECVKIVALDGSLEFMNHAGLCMIEGNSEPSIQGASVYDLIAPEHREDWIERHQRICAGERLSWEFEIIGLKGTRRWMETHAVPLPLPDGRTAQLAVSREITARKQFEQEREKLLESERRARGEAERASQLKDEFLATLSHELRTPLNAIVGWSQILDRDSDQEELREGLDAIQRNAFAQARLIEDLLDMSRIISGKVRLDVQSVDLASVIAAAVDSVRPAADAKGIILRKVIDPHAGNVSGDPTRLQQVVWNLLSNSIKFTPKAGKIDVILERVNSHLELTVHDTGIGIALEHLPVIFERFRQVDSSTTRSYGGLGIGLSIVKQLIELHGGSVRAKSAGEGQGSTFVISLPLSPIRGEEDREHPRSGKMADFKTAQVNLAGVKVLVVDDEPDARALVKRVLMQCGAEVSTAGCAAEGLAQLREFSPDVVVSDIGMPGTDGYQFIREVRSLDASEGGKTPAIALTAFARSEDRMRAMMAGYQVHVAKPIEPQELAVTVHSLCR